MMLIYGYSLPHKFQFVNAKLINKMNLYYISHNNLKLSPAAILICIALKAYSAQQ